MKFEIFQSEKDNKYYFNLKAKNGQVILSSQGYAQKAGAKTGIESVRKNCGDDSCFEKKEAATGRPTVNPCGFTKTRRYTISVDQQAVGKQQLDPLRML